MVGATADIAVMRNGGGVLAASTASAETGGSLVHGRVEGWKVGELEDLGEFKNERRKGSNRMNSDLSGGQRRQELNGRRLL